MGEDTVEISGGGGGGEPVNGTSAQCRALAGLFATPQSKLVLLEIYQFLWCFLYETNVTPPPPYDGQLPYPRSPFGIHATQGGVPKEDSRTTGSPLRSYAKGKNALWLLNSDSYRSAMM